MYFLNDIQILELFSSNPTNSDLDTIRMKVSGINDEEFRLYVNADEMVYHIQKLNIEDWLKKGYLTVVEDIANLSTDEKKT